MTTTTYTAMRNALATFIEYNDNGGPPSFDVDAMWANARAALAGAGGVQAEVDTLRQQLAEAQALIEASRKQEHVAYSYALASAWAAEEVKLYTAPVVADDVLKYAQRYLWLREQSWLDNLCVVDSPKNSVKLGSFCPSHGRLDVAIDQAMGGAA